MLMAQALYTLVISILFTYVALVTQINHREWQTASAGNDGARQAQETRPPQLPKPPEIATPSVAQRPTSSSTLEKIETRIKQDGQPELLKDLWMAVDLPITRIKPTDIDTVYSFKGVAYSFIPVEEALREGILARLNRLEELPVTACYKISGPLLKIPLHTRCRFVRSVPFEPNTFKSEAADIFHQWKSELNADSIEKVWVETSARVSQKGAPMEKMEQASPVAILTNKGLYLVIEDVDASGRYFRQGIVHGDRAFSFANTSDLNGSASRLRDIFFEELTNEFGAAPILAQPDLTDRSNGSEIIFKRWNAKSNVVGRENFIKWDWWNSTYERSSFEVQWNCDGSCQNVLIEVNHTFFVSNDNRDYDERKWPANQIQYYLELYRRAATESYLKAVRSTCNRLPGIGMMSGNVCRIRGNVL